MCYFINITINHIIEAFNLEKKIIDDAEADWMLKKDISENYMLFLSIFNG